ncbi:MAG: putative Ig domain-containing protein, partial [Promethearchaeota archaeon]
GGSVARSGDGGTVVAGAAHTAAGGSAQGAAYVYVRPGGGWADATETAKLTASDGADGDWLGYSVALSGDGGTVAAGAYRNAAGGSQRGAAYVYARPGGGWASTAAFTAKLTASDGADNDRLGYSVATNWGGDTVVAGAPYNAAGGSQRGAAYVHALLAAPAFTSGVPPSPAHVGTPYSFTFAASGNPAPIFSVTSGALPPGLTLDGITGALSGTPTSLGSYSFTITASNGVAPDATQVVTIAVHTSVYLPLVMRNY